MQTPKEFFEEILKDTPEDFPLRKYKATIVLMLEVYAKDARIYEVKKLTEKLK